MGWVKLDTSYLRNPKVAPLHPAAKLLHVASILWTAEHLTDGYVPPTALRTLCDDVPIAVRWRRHHASALMRAGLWEPVVGTGGGWMVHDFVTHNHTSTRAYVERERELAAERMRRMRERSGTSYAVTNGAVTPTDKTRQDRDSDYPGERHPL